MYSSFNAWVCSFSCLFLGCSPNLASLLKAAQLNQRVAPSFGIYAHKGGSSLKQENTIEAFKTSVFEVGATYIELDVRPTSDLAIVVNHDSTLNPAFCLDYRREPIPKNLLISNMTLSDIRKYDCGTLGGSNPGAPLPTLDEVFKNLEEMRVSRKEVPQYIIHIKWEGSSVIEPTVFVQAIFDIIAKYNTLSTRVSIMCDKTEILAAAQVLNANINRTLLVNAMSATDYRTVEQLQISRVAPYGPQLDSATVKKLHTLGVQVVPWTVNDPAAWESLNRIGVDGILTDDPFKLKQFIRNGFKIITAPQSAN